MDEIILYTIDCPKCKVLEKKLNNKGITYKTIKDREIMQSMGIDAVPVLSVDGNLKGFVEANSWLNSIGGIR